MSQTVQSCIARRERPRRVSRQRGLGPGLRGGHKRNRPAWSNRRSEAQFHWICRGSIVRVRRGRKDRVKIRPFLRASVLGSSSQAPPSGPPLELLSGDRLHGCRHQSALLPLECGDRRTRPLTGRRFAALSHRLPGLPRSNLRASAFRCASEGATRASAHLRATKASPRCRR
jgi:hypothetical protein